MIYSFAIGDNRLDTLLHLLRHSGVDYESIEHDSAVVRILGTINDDLKHQLDEIANGTGLTLKRSGEINIYREFTEATELPIIAGPCAVESDEQLQAIAGFLKKCGVKFLRGGAYKPRTSVDSFQGLGKPGLEFLRKYADLNDMYVVTEVMDRSQIDLVAEFADVLQVGSRNMYNYTLLTALGSINRPVLLKRGMAATVSEWLKAAEYISRGGNDQIILCERGIRTFEPQTSHTLDIAAIVLARQESPYPVIADASHAAGRPDLITPLACAAVAAGADGIMIEVHNDPATALSDGKQALTFAEFEKLKTAVMKVDKIREHIRPSLRQNAPSILTSTTKSTSVGTTIIARIKVRSVSREIEACDILAWVKGSDSTPRVYWKSRDGQFEFGGIGAAQLLTDKNTHDITSALLSIESTLKAETPGAPLRYFAGTRFDPESKSDPIWHGFPAYWFLLPQVTISKVGEQYVASAFAPDSTTTLSALLDASLRNVTRTNSPAPTHKTLELIERRDIPDQTGWRTLLHKTLAAIKSGALDKAVLARRSDLKFTSPQEPFDLLAQLREANINCHSFLIEPEKGTAFVGSSPERLFTVSGNRLSTEAVAGTIARGATPDEDRVNGEKLMQSRKDQLEQRYVVESLQENLRSLCSSHSSLGVATLLKLSKVQHLINRYEGELRPSVTLADIFATIHPTPAVSGTPRTQAMKLIRDLEGFDRGWYASGVGIISSGLTEFAVAIRSALVRQNSISLFAGAGIVPGSDPDTEWIELEQKISSAIAVLASTGA